MDLLLQWIESLGIDAPTTGIESYFSNGFMFGKLLHATNQLTAAGWGQFVNDDKSDSKIRNYCLLFPKMRQLGIKFDAQIAQSVMRRTPGVAARLLYELQSAIRPLASARVGRSLPGQQRLLRPAARSHKPGFEAKQAEIFERNLRVMAENQNDVLLQAHMAGQASNVSSLQAARDEAHAARLAAHRQRLQQKRAERLHMLRTRHMVTHAREEAGIREWQRNQEIRLAQTLAKKAFQEKTAARRAQRLDTLCHSARMEAGDGIAEFEALAAEQGVLEQPAPLAADELAATIASQQAALADATDGPREDSQDPMERRDALHMRLTRKLASVKDVPQLAQAAPGRAAGLHHALVQRAHRRRAFAMHSRDRRLHLHAAQRHEQVTSLLAWRCEAEVELDDVVARILKHEVIFRQNRAARTQQVQHQREQDAFLEAERQHMALTQHRQQFAADLANACSDMEEAALARKDVQHQRAVDVARAAVLKVVDAAVAIAQARELAGMRLTEAASHALTGCAVVPSVHVTDPHSHGDAHESKEGQTADGEGKSAESEAPPSAAPLVLPEGGVDAVSWLQVRVAYSRDGHLQRAVDAAAPYSLPLPPVAASVADASDAESKKSGKKGKKGDDTEGEATHAAAAAVQARALQYMQEQLLGSRAGLPADSGAGATSPAEQQGGGAHEEEGGGVTPCGVQLPQGACVALMGASGDQAGLPSHGVAAGASQELGEGSLATATLSFFHGAAADARAALEDHEPWGEGEEAARRRIVARSQGRDSLSSMRSPSAAAAGHAVSLGNTVLYDTNEDGKQDEQAQLESKSDSGVDHEAEQAEGGVEEGGLSAPEAMDDEDASISLHLFKTYLQKAAVWDHNSPRGQVVVDSSAFDAALSPLLAMYPPLPQDEEETAAAGKKQSKGGKGKAGDKGAVEIQLPPPAVHGTLADVDALRSCSKVLPDVVARLAQAVKPRTHTAPQCDVPQFPITMALLGPPGSGVTTHSRFLAAAFKLRLIQPRKLITQALALADDRLPLEHCTLPPVHALALRKIGQHARDALRAGHSVPDVLVVQAIVTAVRALGKASVEPTLHLEASDVDQQEASEVSTGADEYHGWILDGFPGTTAQACLLEEALTWRIPSIAPGQMPSEIIPGQGLWTALRGAPFVAPGTPVSAAKEAFDAWQALAAGERQPHPVLDADADEENGVPTAVDDERCAQTGAPPAPRHAHGLKLVLSLGMSSEAALRRVLGLRVDSQRLVTLAAVDDEVPASEPSVVQGNANDLGGATLTGDGVYGHEVVDSTVKAGARGLNAAAAQRSDDAQGGLSVKVRSSAQEEAHAGGSSAAVAPRESTATEDLVASTFQGSSAVLSRSSVPSLPLAGSIAAVDDVGPEGETSAWTEHKQQESVVADDGVMQVAPSALLPVMSDGYVVRAKAGNVVYHLDSNPPAHKCKTVVQMSPPWAVPLQSRAQLNASVAEGSPVLQPAQLALVMERFWATHDAVRKFYSADGRGRFATVSAYKPCEGSSSAPAAVVDGTGKELLNSSSWDEYTALGAWAQGHADALNEAELFAVLKRTTAHFKSAIAAEEAARAQAWEAVQKQRAASVDAHAQRLALQLKQRRGEDVHEQVVSALEAAAAAAAAEAEAAAEAKKNKGGKGKDTSAAGEQKEQEEDEHPEQKDAEEAAGGAHGQEGAPPADQESDEAVRSPASLDEPYKFVPALPLTLPSDEDKAQSEDGAGVPAVKSPSGGVSFAASVTFSEGKEQSAAGGDASEAAADEEEVDDATRLAAEAAGIVVVPTRQAGAASAALPMSNALVALHTLWGKCATHYGSGTQAALRAVALEQRAVHVRLGAVQRFLLRFLRRPVLQYDALMKHAQSAINAPSWSERMGPAHVEGGMTPAEALLHQRVQAALQAEAAASKKPAGKGDKGGDEPSQPSEAELRHAAATAAAAKRAELAEVVETAASGMLAVAASRREAAQAYIAARSADAWTAHVKSALAAHLCEMLQLESDRLAGERMVLLGYFRALDGADGVGVWTGHNAAASADGNDSRQDSLASKSSKAGKDKKASKGHKSGDDDDAMPDSAPDMLKLQALLEGRILDAAGVKPRLAAAGAMHPAVAHSDEQTERPSSSLKQKRSKSPKHGKDEEDDAEWPVPPAQTPAVCMLAPPVSPCVAVVPVAPPADVLPSLKKVPAVQQVLPDGADALWDTARDAAESAEAATAPTSARSGTPRSKSRQGAKAPLEEATVQGVLQLPLGWGEDADWEEVQETASEAQDAIRAVLSAAVHGVGVHVGVSDELSQELLRVLDACCASVARASLAGIAARHRHAQDAALEAAVAEASDGKGKKGKGGKGGKKSKSGSKDKKGKKGEDATEDPALEAVAWKAAACPVQDDTGVQAVQNAMAVCERLATSVLKLVHAAAETQEIQRQRHAAEAVARERRRRRLLQEAAAAAQAAAEEAAAEAEAAAAAAAAESLGSKKGGKAPKDKSKDKSKDKKGAKGGKGGVEMEESHLPEPDVTHATVDPAVWTAITHRVTEFRERCHYIGSLATQLLGAVDAAAERAWAASHAAVDALISQEVQAISSFRATALRAIATGARLPYRLRFVRPHADLDLDLMPAPMSLQGAAEHAVGTAASALAQSSSIVPPELYVPALSGAVVSGLHEYQLPSAGDFGSTAPHAFPQSAEAAMEAPAVGGASGGSAADGKQADEEQPPFQLLAPPSTLSTTHAPPCAAPDAPLAAKLQDYFKLHFQVDLTERVLPAPTVDPRPPLLLEDTPSEAAVHPKPSQLYAFALRLRAASLASKHGGPFHARAYNVPSGDLWPSPPPMVAEATQLTDGASEADEEAPAAADSLASAKGSKSLKDKDKKGAKGKDKAEEEDAAAIAAAVRAAQAALLESETALQGEELIPAGTFITVQEFIQAVHDAVAAQELPATWRQVPDGVLASIALSFVSELSEWAPWEVRVEEEPSSSVAARKAYAAWQMAEVERLLAEEAAAQARADAEEAARLGITAAEVVEMRQAAEQGEDVSHFLPAEEETSDATPRHRADSAGSHSGASTPRTAVSDGSVLGEVVEVQGSVALGSPLDVAELSALQSASVVLPGDASPTQEGDGDASDDQAAQSAEHTAAPAPAEVSAVEDVQPEDATPVNKEVRVQLPPSGEASSATTPDDTLSNFARLCPGPTDWPWQDPASITARKRVVLHHPLLHHQVPLRISPQEWEHLVKVWGDKDAKDEPSAKPSLAHHRDLAQALQSALAAADEQHQHESVDFTAAATASQVLSSGTVTPMGDFGRVAWPPILQDLTTSGAVASVQPVTVAGFGSVWIDFDPSYSAAIDTQADAASDSKHSDAADAFQADADAAAGSAPQLSLPSVGSAEGPVPSLPALEQRIQQAVAQGTADALRELYPPTNFTRLVDWRGVVAWLSITGPSPSSTAFLEATLSSVHAESKQGSGTDIVSTSSPGMPQSGAAGSGEGGAVQTQLWASHVQGGRDFMIQDITGYSTLVGKGWGVATWPRHEQLDELAVACEGIAQDQLSSEQHTHSSAREGAEAEATEADTSEGKGADAGEGKDAEVAMTVDTAVHVSPAAEADMPPLGEGQVRVLQPSMTPHAATPLQPAPVAEEEDKGTPRSKAKSKAKKGAGKGSKKGPAEEEAPLVLQLRPRREWKDPLAEMGAAGAVADEVLLPEAADQLPLWFERQGLHEKAQSDAVADIAAAAAVQGSDLGGAAATAEGLVDSLIGTVSAQRSAASQETGGAVGWHHISGDHSSREALFLADMSARARQLRELQEQETHRYTELADRDVLASVDHGDRIMRGVLLQALSDVYGRLDYARLLRHWRRHVQLQEQLMRQEVEEGIMGRRSRMSHDTEPQEVPAPADEAPVQPSVRFAAAARSACEMDAVAQADQEVTLFPEVAESLQRDIYMDVYAVLLRSIQHELDEAAVAQKAAAAELAAEEALQAAAAEQEEGGEGEADGKDQD